jgi:hypothetical protein
MISRSCSCILHLCFLKKMNCYIYCHLWKVRQIKIVNASWILFWLKWHLFMWFGIMVISNAISAVPAILMTLASSTLFQIVCHFGFDRFTGVCMHLDIYYTQGAIAKTIHLEKPKWLTIWNVGVYVKTYPEEIILSDHDLSIKSASCCTMKHKFSTDQFFPQHPLILIGTTNSLMVALVLVPTRELCLQVYGIAQQLVHRFHWIVPGYVMGGENRAKEKARLRKGRSRLIVIYGIECTTLWCHAFTLDICF